MPPPICRAAPQQKEGRPLLEGPRVGVALHHTVSLRRQVGKPRHGPVHPLPHLLSRRRLVLEADGRVPHVVVVYFPYPLRVRQHHVTDHHFSVFFCHVPDLLCIWLLMYLIPCGWGAVSPFSTSPVSRAARPTSRSRGAYVSLTGRSHILFPPESCPSLPPSPPPCRRAPGVPQLRAYRDR